MYFKSLGTQITHSYKIKGRPSTLLKFKFMWLYMKNASHSQTTEKEKYRSKKNRKRKDSPEEAAAGILGVEPALAGEPPLTRAGRRRGRGWRSWPRGAGSGRAQGMAAAAGPASQWPVGPTS